MSPFVPFDAQGAGIYFRDTPANSALTWVTVSQNSSPTLSFDTPGTSIRGYSGQFPAHHRGLGQGVPGPPLLADGEVVEPFVLVGVP